MDELERTFREISRKLDGNTDARLVSVTVDIWQGGTHSDDPANSTEARISHDGLDIYVRHFAGDLVQGGWAEMSLDATGAKALGLELVRMADAMINSGRA